MSYSSLGAKRQPQFADGDAPDVAVNPTQVANYAAEFGNHKIGTTAERTAASSWAWADLNWDDTTNGIRYRYTGSAWNPESGYASASLARSTDLVGGSGTSPTPAAFQSAPALRGMTWAVGQPSRLGCLIPGRYLMQAIGAVGSTASASAWLRINGTINRPAGPSVAQVGGLSTITLTDVLTLAAGDYVELMTQTNGAFNLYSATSLNADLVNPR